MPICTLAKVTGVILGKDGKPAPKGEVSYQDARTIKEWGPTSWGVKNADENGRWVMYEPTGPLTITATDNGRFVGSMKFDSTFQAARREIVIDLSKSLGPENPLRENVTEYLRVLNPDGVAVPRPRLKAEAKQNPLFQQGGGLDGTIAVRDVAGTRVKLTSPYLSHPAYVELARDGRWTTITFDFPQDEAPTVTEMAAAGIGFG
jgi:hypothetical protein